MDKRMAEAWATQRVFQERLGIVPEDMTRAEIAGCFKNNAYFVTEELHEAGRELPYIKEWKDYSKLTSADRDARMDRAVEEMADAFTFFINLCMLLGISSEQLLDAYFAKNGVNHERQNKGYYEEETK